MNLQVDAMHRTTFRLLDLILFYSRPRRVPPAAAWNHSASSRHHPPDMERGHPREVVPCEDYVHTGSFPEAKKQGVFRLKKRVRGTRWRYHHLPVNV